MVETVGATSVLRYLADGELHWKACGSAFDSEKC